MGRSARLLRPLDGHYLTHPPQHPLRSPREKQSWWRFAAREAVSAADSVGCGVGGSRGGEGFPRSPGSRAGRSNRRCRSQRQQGSKSPQHSTDGAKIEANETPSDASSQTHTDAASLNLPNSPFQASR